MGNISLKSQLIFTEKWCIILSNIHHQALIKVALNEMEANHLINKNFGITPLYYSIQGNSKHKLNVIVTYFSAKKTKLSLTSNRDEKPSSFCPKKFIPKTVFTQKMLQKKGLGFIVSESGNVIILLNGAFLKTIKRS